MRWPFCLGRFEKLCLCAASLVLSMRPAVHKQSFLKILFFQILESDISGSLTGFFTNLCKFPK